MNKKQIIDKIIDDLPTRDLRGEMSPQEWYGWFEEAFDKGYAEALRIHDVSGRSEQLLAFAEFIDKDLIDSVAPKEIVERFLSQ